LCAALRNTPQPPAPGTGSARTALVNLPGAQHFFYATASTALIIAALYLGQDLLIPLALAALMAFVLAPLVEWLRRRGVPQRIAVGLVCVATLIALVMAGVLVARQLRDLVIELPTYQQNIQSKLRQLRESGSGSDFLKNLTRLGSLVQSELSAGVEAAAAAASAISSRTSGRTRLERTTAEPAAAPALGTATAPMIVQDAPPSALREFGTLAAPVLVPAATAGFVLVLVVFMLSQRREMRDRVVRLIGGDVHRVTDALDEAADRVSRYLGAQVLVNVGYGVPMALGLWWLGVPGAFLWGALAAVLRFVPYLGPAVGATFPLLLAFAVDPGWSMVLWAAGLVLALELISNNVVEPLAYGGSTGVSPVAVLVSAAFWAVIWGPMGLVLATPMTVCLVVMSRHVGSWRALDILLGNDPVFDLRSKLYQRLISDDIEEALEMSLHEVETSSLKKFYSDTAVPMLTMAARAADTKATAAHRLRVVEGGARVIAELRQAYPPAPPETPVVLCLGARNEFDTLSAEMLAHVLQHDGSDARALPAAAISADRLAQLSLGGVAILVLCTHAREPQTHARFVFKRLRRARSDLRIVLAAWSGDATLVNPAEITALGADAVATSLSEATKRVLAELQDLPAGSSLTVPSSAPGPGPGPGPRDSPLQTYLSRAAQRAADVFGVPLATVTWRLDDGGVVQECAGSSGWTLDPDQVELTEGSPLWHVLNSGERLLIKDIAREPAFAGKQPPRFDGFMFLAAVPLRDAGEQVMGVLAIHDSKPRMLAAGDIKLLEEMAGDLSVSVPVPAPAPAPS
jgi:predicted PurR-regulated permease PerM